MCGRFSQAFTWEEIVGFSNLISDPANVPNLQARYNIAPTTEINIIVKTELGRVLRKARWGLIPAWHRGTAKEMKAATHNARIETVDSSGMFKQAYVKRRCIIPASGFYEWTSPQGQKIPHRISAADGSLLAFAGLWEMWKDPETGEEVMTATIITRDANKWMSAIHNRMPAMLHPRDFEAWLDGTGGKELLMQPPPELREWIVSQRMNNTRVGDDDPRTAYPVEPAEPNPPPPPPPAGPKQGTLF